MELTCNKHESWKDIDGYEGLYQASNRGRIKSLRKTITYPSGRKEVRPEAIRKLIYNKNGYTYVGLTKNKKQTLHRVHRLIAKAFVPNPNGFPEVNHEDFNKKNNDFENLKWCDKFYQNQHAATKPNRKWQRHRVGMTGKLNPKSKPVVQILSGNIVNRFESACMAAEKLGLQQSKISACCLGKRHMHGGYSWRFADTLIAELNKEK
jgi:hypothetical protein